MHNGGAFPSGKLPSELNAIYSRSNGDIRLVGHGQGKILLIEAQLLRNLSDDLKNFFSQLLWITEKKIGYKIFGDRLHYILRLVADDIRLSTPEFLAIRRGIQITTCLTSVIESLDIVIKITVVDANRQTLDVMDQVETHKGISRLSSYLLMDKSIILQRLLQGFVPATKGVAITFMFYPKH